MRRFILTAAAILATAPGMARAAETPCLTSAEFTSLASYSLPSINSGTVQRCGPSLGAGAFLRSEGRSLATRYASQKAKNWPGAKAAFLKLSNSDKGDTGRMFKDMADAPLQNILDAMMEGMVSQQIPVERCGTIDRLVRLLAPLPPENTAELIALAVGLGAKGTKPRVGKLNICEA